MRLLVCGGRDFTDKEFVYFVLDHFKEMVETIIHGDAVGADSLGGAWAADSNIHWEAYPADWDGHGKKAGPIRNQQMLDEGKPTLVLAFPGSKGTQDMIIKSLKYGVSVISISQGQYEEWKNKNAES